jgi:hypothetical protein
MQTISHWLIHQLWLTWHQIQADITIPRIVTGIIGYGIIHGGWKFINREQELLEHKRSVALLHVKKRHKGRFSHCSECRTILIHYQTAKLQAELARLQQESE